MFQQICLLLSFLFFLFGYKANGSARVRIGGTDVIASVKVLPLLLSLSTMSC